MSTLLVYGIAISAAAAVLYGAFRCFGPRSSGVTLPGEIAPELRILTRTRVGVGRTLVLIEVDGRRLLLGSTREQWSALADLGGVRAPGREFDGIEEELLRASESARLRRGMRS